MRRIVRKLAPRTYWRHRMANRRANQPGNASRYRQELRAAELWQEAERRRY